MKKILSAIISFVVLIAALLPVNSISFALEDDVVSGPIDYNATYYFDKSTGELTIDGYGMIWTAWSVQYDLNCEKITPSEVNKLTVKNGITILDSTMLMGAFEMDNWVNLTEITLPESLKKIQGDFSRCPSLTTINYAGTENDWDKIIFRDNQKELFSGLNFNYSVEVPEATMGESGKDNEIVTIKIKPDENITCTLDFITEKLVVSGKGNLYIPADYYDTYFPVAALFASGHAEDDARTPYITDVVVESGITKLCSDNFNFGGLKSITIPKSITEIEANCFAYLDANKNSELEVYYEGSIEDWNKIEIGEYNELLTKGNIHYASTVSESESSVSDNASTEAGTAESTASKSPDTGFNAAGISVAAAMMGAAGIYAVIKKKKK